MQLTKSLSTFHRLVSRFIKEFPGFIMHDVNLIVLQALFSVYCIHKVTCLNMGGTLLELQNKLEEQWLDIQSNIRGAIYIHILLREACKLFVHKLFWKALNRFDLYDCWGVHLRTRLSSVSLLFLPSRALSLSLSHPLFPLSLSLSLSLKYKLGPFSLWFNWNWIDG